MEISIYPAAHSTATIVVHFSESFLGVVTERDAVYSPDPVAVCVPQNGGTPAYAGFVQNLEQQKGKARRLVGMALLTFAIPTIEFHAGFEGDVVMYITSGRALLPEALRNNMLLFAFEVHAIFPRATVQPTMDPMGNLLRTR